MKKIITIFLIIFSFQNWTKADEITDFEIEGITVVNSLLDFFTIEQFF